METRKELAEKERDELTKKDVKAVLQVLSEDEKEYFRKELHAKNEAFYRSSHPEDFKKSINKVPPLRMSDATTESQIRAEMQNKAEWDTYIVHNKQVKETKFKKKNKCTTF